MLSATARVAGKGGAPAAVAGQLLHLLHPPPHSPDTAGLHTSIPQYAAGILGGPHSKDGPRGELEEGTPDAPASVEELKHDLRAKEQEVAGALREQAQRAREDPACAAKQAAEGAKRAAAGPIEFAKETVSASAGYAHQAAEKARHEAARAVGLEEPRTDKQIDDELEERMRRGVADFTPEATGSKEERDGSAGTTARSQLDPSLVRGDTVGIDPTTGPACGATSREARVGGQPAGTVGKPPPLPH